MYSIPSLRFKRGKFIILFALILALFCRGLWAAEQSIHKSAPVISPAIQLIEHGHYHEPVLEHHHSDYSGVTETSHHVFHLMGEIDNQMEMFSLAPSPQSPHFQLYLTKITSTHEPPLSGLFRPPKR
jgi:hypothetical protein